MSNIEYELRVLEIDVEKIRKKLRSLGAKESAERNYKRHVYDTVPYTKGRWVRLRTDGTTTTLTLKQISSDDVDGTEEYEVIVDDFDTTHKILELAGLKSKGYQENSRIEFKISGALVCIDRWPKIPPYLEIEASSEANVLNVAKKLGYSPSELTGLNTEKIYLKYGIDISKKADLSF